MLARYVTPVVGLVLAATVAGCGDDHDGRRRSPASTDAPPASDLAPSQIAATTVARPATPPPCDPGVLVASASAASTNVHVAPTVAVVTIVNEGAVRCEVDVSASAEAGAAMEPDVWLEPGAAAELLVDEEPTGCAAPVRVTAIELVLVGGSLAVALPPIEVCGVVLSAFYPA